MFFDKLRKRMKGVIIVVCVAFALTLLYVGGGSFFGSPPPQAEAVAEVNGDRISTLELQQAFVNTVNFYRQFGQNVSRAQEEDVRYSTLRQLIDRQLMLQAAKSERVAIDEGEIDRRFNQIKENVGGNFQDVLRQEGLTERGLRDFIRDDLLIQAVREEKSEVDISEEQVRQAYEESREKLSVRHILIEPESADGEKDWDKAFDEANSLLTSIRSGADFAALAQEHSDDPGSRSDGGDLGLVGRDDPLVPEFLDAAFGLEVDEISEPVRTQFGYHLISVTDRKIEEGEPFEEVKESIESDLQEAQSREKFQGWLEGQRIQAEVKIFDPQMRAHQFVQSDRLDQAISQYREAITERPEDPYLYYRLALVLQEVGAEDEALEAHVQATEKGGADPQLLFALGSVYRNRDEKEQAKDAFVRASELSPNDVRAHQMLAQIFQDLGYEELSAQEQAKVSEIQKVLAEEARKQQESLAEQRELERRLEEARKTEDEKAPDAPDKGDGEPANEPQN